MILSIVAESNRSDWTRSMKPRAVSSAKYVQISASIRAVI